MIDVDEHLAHAGNLADTLGELVERALDTSRPFEERSDAAFDACTLIRNTGALTKLRAAKAWIAANRASVDRALALGAFVQKVRGR